MGLPIPPSQILFDTDDRREMVDRRLEFVEEMTKATIAGNVGETQWGEAIDPQRPDDYRIGNQVIGALRRDPSRASEVRKALDDVEMVKSVGDSNGTQWLGGRSEYLSKEWTLTNPLSTGLIPYDLEAPEFMRAAA